MKMKEQIGEYTVKIDGSVVTAHRGDELRYSKDHGDDESTAVADFDGLCNYVSEQTGIARPLPPPPDFVGTINWGRVDALIKGGKK